MISPDFRFEGFGADSWSRLLALPSRPGLKTPRGRETVRLLVIVDTRGRVLRANHSLQGRLSGLGRVTPADLPSLAAAHGVDQVLFVEEGASETLAEAFQAQVQPADDFLDQWLLLLRQIRALQNDGALAVWPDPIGGLPVPSRSAVLQAMNLFVPPHRSALLAISDGGRPHAFALIQRGRSLVEGLLGPEALPDLIDMDLCEVLRRPKQAVGRLNARVAPVHLGVFADRRVIAPLLSTFQPGRWARAAVRRELRLYPVPPQAVLGLAADGLLGALPSLGQRARGPLMRLLAHLRRAETVVGSPGLPFPPPPMDR